MGKQRLITDGTGKKQKGIMERFLTQIVPQYMLKHNFIKNDREKIITLLELHRQNSEDEYVQQYLNEISNGKRKKFSITLNELWTMLNEKGFEENSLMGMGLCTATLPHDLIKDYIISKPKQFLSCINVLFPEEVEEVLTRINDQEYCAQLLLSINTSNSQQIANFFPHIQDEYIRAQIILSHSVNDIVKSPKEAMENIREFLKIKEYFLTLSDSEKIKFLCEAGSDKDNNEDNVARKKRNLVKQSLLQYIPNHEDRMKVIATLEHKVPEDMEHCETLTRQMILEYIEDNFVLNERQIERLHIALNSFDMFFSRNLPKDHLGAAYHDNYDIRIHPTLKENMRKCILVILHERAHTFSKADFLISGYWDAPKLEEGMADNFAELVANYYFTKHPDQFFRYRHEIGMELPLLDSSGFKHEYQLAKCMLYPLEGTERDWYAVQEYLLGDKKMFWDMCMGEGFSRRFWQDYLGNPLQIGVTEQELLFARGTSYIELNPSSKYLPNNDLIYDLSLRAKSQAAVQVRRFIPQYPAQNQKQGQYVSYDEGR